MHLFDCKLNEHLKYIPKIRSSCHQQSKHGTLTHAVVAICLMVLQSLSSVKQECLALWKPLKSSCFQENFFSESCRCISVNVDDDISKFYDWTCFISTRPLNTSYRQAIPKLYLWSSFTLCAWAITVTRCSVKAVYNQGNGAVLKRPQNVCTTAQRIP